MKRFFKSRLPFLIAYALGVTPLLPLLQAYPEGLPRDWPYFDSLALVLKDRILHGVAPLIDPVICGGVDLLANPQNWIFSPFILLTILFPPFLANWLSLVISAAFGVHGMSLLTRGLVHNVRVRAAFSCVFLLSPFFSLHFAEGHIVFRTFYFLPWILHLARNMISLRQLATLSGLLVWQLLDGGLYPLYFSVIVVLLNLRWREFHRILTQSGARSGLWMMLVSIPLLASAKMLPVLFLHHSRTPQNETGTYSLQNLITAFFNIRVTIDQTLPGLKYYLHEYAHYFGIGCSGLLLWALVRRPRKWVMFQLLIFLWISLGIGAAVNPYSILKLIPFVNQIHVQSRFLILVFLMVLWAVMESIGNKRRVIPLLIVAIAELLYANLYSSWHAVVDIPNAASVPRLQIPVTAAKYEYHIPKPAVYSSGALSYACYEPANAGPLFPDLGTIVGQKIEGAGVTVGRHSLEVKSSSPIKADFVLNFHWNGGWACEGCDAVSNEGLIEVHPKGSGDTLRLTYDPVYWPLVLVSYVSGLLLFLYSLVRIHREL